MSNTKITRPPVLAALGMAAALAAAAVWTIGTRRREGEASGPPAAPASAGLTPEQAMMWKYVARCALRGDQELSAPAPAGAGGGAAAPATFHGDMGLAPEWKEGQCDRACQEKVSACLFALTNPTGHHVQVSLLSGAPSLAALMGPSDADREFPFQEGAFFGNVFEGESYVCRGSDAGKGAQLKRVCAANPEQCRDAGGFVSAGACQDRCEMSCSRLSDGTRRCVAVRCQDPQGRVWDHPITTYLRDRIEAGNADAMVGAIARDTALEELRDGGLATYRRVDFGRDPGGVHALVANLAASQDGGRIEVWLDGQRRLGVLPVRSTHGVATDLSAPLHASGLTGPHDVVLRFASLGAGTRLTNIAFR